MYLYRGTIQQVRHLGRGREKTKKTANDRKKERRVVKIVMSLIQILIYTFFCVTESLFLLGFS